MFQNGWKRKTEQKTERERAKDEKEPKIINNENAVKFVCAALCVM